tara:strand:+ start:278 stop:511 length:234 start_codon:yes stop_codon:yes gene_type:complete
MATIDQEGVMEINEKVKNPLESMYKKLDKLGVFNHVSEEFDFLYKFLNEIENDWQRSVQEDPTVLVNGKAYKPEGGR